MARDLPVNFATFAITAGFVATDRWSEASIESFKRSWRKILLQKNAGRAVLSPVSDRILKESIHEQSIRILVLYPQISKDTIIAPKKSKPRFVQMALVWRASTSPEA